MGSQPWTPPSPLRRAVGIGQSRAERGQRGAGCRAMGLAGSYTCCSWVLGLWEGDGTRAGRMGKKSLCMG